MNTIQKYLRWIILAGIFAVPFLAFYVPNANFFPFITGKNFAFRIIVEIIFAAWLLLVYYNESYRPKHSWLMAGATTFVAVIFFADLFGENPLRSFWSNYERMEGFVGLIHTYAYFVVVGSVLSRELWTRFFQTWLVSSIIMAIYCLRQLSGALTINQGGVRIDGTFGNAAYLAVFMLSNIFLALYLAARHGKKDWLLGVYLGVALVDTYILYYTATRGAILGLLVGAAVTSACIAIFDRKHPAMRKWFIGILAAMMLFVGMFVSFKNTPFVKNSMVLSRLASISLTEGTTKSRFMVWGMAIDGLKEHPVLGWGQENYNLVFSKYYNPKMWQQEQWFDRAHDIFLDWLVAGGILGLSLYLGLFALGIILIWKPETDVGEEGFFEHLKRVFAGYFSGEKGDRVAESGILTGLFAAYFVHNIFVFDNLFSYILFFTILAYLHHLHSASLSAHVMKGKDGNRKSGKSEQVPFLYASSAVVVVLAVVLYNVNMKPIFANRALILAIQPAEANGSFSSKNIEYFKTVFDYNTFGNSEAREQAVSLVQQILPMNIDQKMKEEMFGLARKQALLQIAEAPKDARAEVFAGTLFYGAGMGSDAVKHFERAHELSPNKQTISANLVLAYIATGQKEKAVSLAKEAYELDTTNTDAAKTYAITLLAAGDQKASDELFMKVFGTKYVFDDNLINLYGKLKNYDAVITIFREEMKKNDSLNVRLRLIAAYADIGKNAEAIRELERAIADYPAFKDQGEYFINLIRTGKTP